ncbi:hypothetical protein A5753_22900 [Mycobacterium sp. 852002-51971_SCH5477799-a]|nr:hypothetical protein A5753_22900 [Mycobacterium sp. 852002-51971_SCH5477799-a]
MVASALFELWCTTRQQRLDVSDVRMQQLQQAIDPWVSPTLAQRRPNIRRLRFALLFTISVILI